MKKTLSTLIIGAFLLAGCNQTSTPSSTGTPSAVAQTPAAVSTPAQTSTPEPTAASNEFLITPGVSIGAINKDSTEAQLKEAFGAENVVVESIYVGDGMEWPGIAVFPNDPEKRVDVVYQDGTEGKVTFLKLTGQKSVWATAEGISLGTDIATLQKLNEKPFQLMGLEWDFGGNISDWKEGKLKGMNLRLGLNGEDLGLTEDEMSAILGDQQVMSDHPAMMKANPTVFEITVHFPGS